MVSVAPGDRSDGFDGGLGHGPAHWQMETAAAFHPITYGVESIRSLIL